MGLWDALFIMAFIVLPIIIAGWSIVMLRKLPPSQRTFARRRARNAKLSTGDELDVTNEAASAARRPRSVVYRKGAAIVRHPGRPSGDRRPVADEQEHAWRAGSELTPPTV